jgi:acyl-[acyl carrier protein]--UDP-N-acetylglucosamine O-acyltransferase
VGYTTPQKDYLTYCAKYGKESKVYSFDLNGHGTSQFPEKNIYALAGFSDKIFDVIDRFEKDKAAMIHAIEAVEL